MRNAIVVIMFLGCLTIIAMGACDTGDQHIIKVMSPVDSTVVNDTTVVECDTIYVPIDIHYMYDKRTKGCKVCHKKGEDE